LFLRDDVGVDGDGEGLLAGDVRGHREVALQHARLGRVYGDGDEPAAVALLGGARAYLRAVGARVLESEGGQAAGLDGDLLLGLRAGLEEAEEDRGRGELQVGADASGDGDGDERALGVGGADAELIGDLADEVLGLEGQLKLPGLLLVLADLRLAELDVEQPALG